MALEFDIDGKLYKSGKLDVFVQSALVKRLLMVAGPLTSAHKAFALGDMAGALSEAARGLAQLADADLEYIQKTCLGVVYRKQGENMPWAAVLPAGGKLAFDDIELLEMNKIVFYVLKDNLSNFFSGLFGSGLTAPK